MYTIIKNTVYQYEIKKSKFITLIYRVNDINEVKTYLAKNKQDYPNATHYCFAYKIGNIQKFSDDKEPNGTAGMPIIEVINKKNLDYILCIVIRYFGGIKLGSGGLIRAYSNAVKNAILEDNIAKIEIGYLIKIETDYDNQKQMDYMLKDKKIAKEFNDKITYYIEIKKEELNLFFKYNYQIIKEKIIVDEKD